MPASSFTLFDFPEFIPITPIIAAGRTEAETLTIGSGFAAKSNPHPSGGRYLEATAASSQAGGIFSGERGYYDLTVGYFDETDGQSIMEVVVNGEVVHSFEWNAANGTSIVTAASKAEAFIPRVLINPGDVIELRGAADGGEPLRTDYIDVSERTPVSDARDLSLEAEDLNVISGFQVVRNGAASGDHVLQHSSGSLARANFTMDQSGTYDLTINFFDEHDGVSELWISINGQEVDRFSWDSSTGSSIANHASKAAHVIQGLELETGDVIEFAGRGDGGEPLRLDSLNFKVSENGNPPTQQPPDLWYEDGDHIVIALNDGTGAFTEVVTSITTDVTHNQNGSVSGGSAFLSVDLNGDGYNDFLKVFHSATSVPDVSPQIVSVPFSYDVTTEVYLNDGHGNFALGASSTERMDVDIYSYAAEFPRLPDDLFKAFDAGDIDGDGDVEFLAGSYHAESIYVFENDGQNNFSLQARSYLELGSGGNEGKLGDMNGDGLLDAVVLNGTDRNSVIVMTNDGSGGMIYTDSIMPSEAPAGNSQLIDLDGDTDLDVLLIAGGDARGIHTYLNDGSGNAERDWLGVIVNGEYYEGGEIGSVAAGDFDGDGEVEVVTAAYMDEEYGVPRGLRVFDIVDNGGDLEFEEASYDASIVGSVLAPEDYDADGDLDLLIISDGVRMLVNDGAGNFKLSDPVVEDFATSEYSGAPQVGRGVFHTFDEFVL
ncbi:FG-GAP repeat domain-containing protein [Alloyangia pacifica]|uniref:FG-GAP repeat domain-containing protein n=1 Tax=Alloyangia pacifica TaxID=311180 RepID=UPI0031E0333B